MRFLLRPGWIAFVVAVLAFVVACYTLLAPWQFGREEQRNAESRAIAQADATPPVPFASLVPGTEIPGDAVWRRVALTGEFDRAAESVVRLRVVDGSPAFEVLTPLRLTDGRVVVVDRGSVQAGDRGRVPAYAPAPAGPVTVDGRLRTDENDPQARAPLTGEGVPQVYAADSRSVAAATGIRPQPVAGTVTLEAGQPGVLDPIPVAPSGGGAPFSNFSYALQWLTFGAVALVALGLFIRLELLQRKGAKTGTDASGSGAAPAGRVSLRDQLAGRDGYGADAPASSAEPAADPDSADHDSAGQECAGRESAGQECAGRESAGRESAGRRSAGHDVPGGRPR
ncbi:SURF1 family cytochrome oxidase biogenesis protein [Pseudonocardia phyllosphaerae]|uniref:SURF1 family cytochrome oxidase biogenesis protein n=1 Tax=Pseudonocardia phyllosphaerae TaxID=3390502 RepID=UPI003978E5DD